MRYLKVSELLFNTCLEASKLHCASLRLLLCLHMWRSSTWFYIDKYWIVWSSEALKVFSNYRFPPSSPLKPYPKKPSYGKEVIKFPDWNETKVGVSQEHIPVKSVTMVRYSVFISPDICMFGKQFQPMISSLWHRIFGYRFKCKILLF